ncbi:MAG: hypothetical protein OXU20_08755, partial [Myxococcales bacterium]|nr:hypothetical protein [Myxococcales bacterium]
PIGLAGGLALHGYVGDPLAWTDPKGLSGCKGGPGRPPSRGYDRPELETKSGKAVSARHATDDWDGFLGTGQTNIDPRDGLPDPDRIWSADGRRSVRYGPHEMGSKPNKHHYHKETWSPGQVHNELQRVQK